MDPISAIFVMAVLGGLVVKGVDVATDGLLSAEVGAGVRGAWRFAGQDVRARWVRANEKAREVRSRTRSGRAIQGILDDAGAAARTGWLVTRVLFGEARRFGSGARSAWETARDQARSARTERRGDALWPIVRAARSGRVRVQEWAERRAGSGAGNPNPGPNGDPNEPEQGGHAGESPLPCSWTVTSRARFILTGAEEPCGRPATVGPFCAEHAAESRSADYKCARCGATPMGSNPDCDECQALRIARGEVSPYGPPAAEPLDPNGASSGPDPESNTTTETGPNGDSEGETTALGQHCQLCGQGTRAERFRTPTGAIWLCESCAGPRADPNETPNGDPNVPLESTVPDANGHVRCGCCAQLHAPLKPGEHCPHCHIHDHPSQNPNGTTPNPPTTRGPSMDITSAPAAIAAMDALSDRFEGLQSRAAALHAEAETLANDVTAFATDAATALDGMGDFAVGGEADTAAIVEMSVGPAVEAREQAGEIAASLTSAKEAIGAYAAWQHEEFNPSIEAAAGKVADAHAVMQEA